MPPKGFLHRLQAICKSQNEENDGNEGIRVGMWGMREIRVGMRGIGVGMRGIGGRNDWNQGENLHKGVELMN